MPRKPIDFSKTIIYKLVCDDLEVTDCYVGQTTDFSKRKSKHKYDCNNINSKSYNYNVYKFIRDNGGFENWTMVMIQRYPCYYDALAACKRKRHWYKRLGATLNTQVPSRTEQEYKHKYHQDNKEEINQKKNTIRIILKQLKHGKNLNVYVAVEVNTPYQAKHFISVQKNTLPTS